MDDNLICLRIRQKATGDTTYKSSDQERVEVQLGLSTS